MSLAEQVQRARIPRLPFTAKSPPDRENRPAASPPPQLERLPLFAELKQRATGSPRRVVMDFAPASAAGMAWLNDLQCRANILDFPAALPILAQSQDMKQFALRCQALLPRDPKHLATVVLCWDCLNYLPRPALTQLMQMVAKRCQPGALVHALIAYSSDNMPARPNQFRPLGEDQVEITRRTDKDRQAPRYAPKELLRHLPGYDIERVMLLRNGYQEFILRVLGPDESVKEKTRELDPAKQAKIRKIVDSPR